MVLYVVATPIGNLEDITFRALRILKEVDLIVAEDTRHTRKLLDHFFFVGFLPEKPGKRQKYIETLKNLPHTIVIYLSRWKAAKHLEELAQIFGERNVCLGREITKMHEEFWRGSLSELAKKVVSQPPKGEMTLVIEGFKE